MDVDTAWNVFIDKFDTYFEQLPCKKPIDSLCSAKFAGCPNVLLYSAGFPVHLVIKNMISQMFGSYSLSPKTIDTIIFDESVYHFEIDFSLPTQCLELEKINEFVKNIIIHSCIHNDRHIIILHHIDILLRHLGAFQMFRVFLERYYNNVIFICTTKKVTQIEAPLLSRFLSIRIPLFTEEQIAHIFTDLGLSVPQHIPAHMKRNLSYCIFASCTNYSSNLRYPFLRDYFGTTTQPSMEQLRSLTLKLHTYNVSISDLVCDLMIIYEKKRETILAIGTQIDWMLSSTNSNRRPLYIEYLLNAVSNL
jgi:hypothetical protein